MCLRLLLLQMGLLRYHRALLRRHIWHHEFDLCRDCGRRWLARTRKATQLGQRAPSADSYSCCRHRSPSLHSSYLQLAGGNVERGCACHHFGSTRASYIRHTRACSELLCSTILQRSRACSPKLLRSTVFQRGRRSISLNLLRPTAILGLERRPW